MVSQSKGFRQRKSISSTFTPCSRSSFCAACRARGTTAPYVITVKSVPGRTTFALPNGIIAADGGAQQSRGILRVRREDYAQPGNVREDALATLGVIDGAAGQVAA